LLIFTRRVVKALAMVDIFAVRVFRVKYQTRGLLESRRRKKTLGRREEKSIAGAAVGQAALFKCLCETCSKESWTFS
jgi:hypothetical protein